MKVSLRLISFLLAALICLSLLPIGIMANEDTAAEDAQNETTEDTTEEIPVTTPETSATNPVSGTDAEDDSSPTPTPTSTPVGTSSPTDASDYETFTLSFDANGGSGAPGSITVLLDESITIPSTKPTRSGYTFQGWSCTKNGEVQYKAGTTYSSVASDLLYAVWGVTITFNANGGSGAPSSRTKIYAQPFTIPTTKPTRSGYTFEGWSTVKNGTVQYKAGSTYKYLDSTTLYAVWSVTVKFDANGGSGAPASATKLYAQPFTIPTTKPTRSGYTFQGWSTVKNGTVQYKAGSTYKYLDSTTLYAVWSVTVKFDANGGSGAPASATKLYAQPFTIPTTKPTRTGYTFQGWSTVKNGTVQYKAGSTYKYLDSTTLYAVWGVTITFNANGGSGAPSSRTKIYAQSFTIPTIEPTRSGYIFQGWSCTKNGTVQYKAGSSYKYLDSTTLYAVWVKDEYVGSTTAGWHKYNGNWYYFSSDGVMKKSSWLKSSGSWYYLRADGKMAAGMKLTISGSDYIFNSSGVMATGWVKLDGSWYYCNTSGVVKKSSWLKSGGYWYYLKSNGKMAVNGTLTISGTSYTFDSSGHLVS